MLINGLPSNSHFVEAKLNDPEYAEWAAAQKPGPPTPPPLSEWSPEIARLADVVDRLGEVASILIGTASGKTPPSVTPVRRPVTGIDKVRAAQSKARHLSLVDDVKEAQERWLRNRQQQEGT